MGRWVLRILAAVSLVAAVAVGGLGISSMVWRGFCYNKSSHEWPRTDSYRHQAVQIGVSRGLCVVMTGDSTYGPGSELIDDPRLRLSYQSLAQARARSGPGKLFGSLRARTRFPITTHAGFAFRPHNTTQPGYTSRGLAVAAPAWFVVLALLILPAIQVRRMRLVRRLRYRMGHGLCLRCGYDLRATPERCPECGRAVETRPC